MASVGDLDNEIARLKEQAASLRAEVKLQATALLSRNNPSAIDRLLLAEQQSTAAGRSLTTAGGLTLPPGTSGGGGNIAAGEKKPKRLTPAQSEKLRQRQRDQAAHDQRNLYRACAGITTFKVRDPDPAAVDGGAVLGIRIEVVRSARFLRPYYVLLNRPWANAGTSTTTAPAEDDYDDATSTRRIDRDGRDAAAAVTAAAATTARARRCLRIHRHTLPEAIPVAGLAARHLPAPQIKAGGGGGCSIIKQSRRQDLGAFVRKLRREVVRYHHRLGAIADMRVAAGLEGEGEKEGPNDSLNDGAPRPRPPPVAIAESEGASGADADAIVDISPTDPAATQVKLEWADGRVGRLVMGPGGELVKSVVIGPRGRDRATERDVFGSGGGGDARARVEDVVARLRLRWGRRRECGSDGA